MSSMDGTRGPAGSNVTRNEAGRNMRGVDPSMKRPKSGHRFQQMTPEQMELWQSLFGYVDPESFLARLAGGDESMFAEMEAPAWRDLNRAQGQLGNRFSQFREGAMSAQKGSGHGLAQNQLSSDFAQDLQSKRLGLQRQAQGDLMNYSQQLLGNEPYGMAKKQSSPGFLESFLGSGAGGDVFRAFSEKMFNRYL